MRIKLNLRFKVAERWDDLTEWQCDRIGDILFNKMLQDQALFKYALIFILFIPKPTFGNIFKALVLFFMTPLQDLEDYTAFVFDKEQYMTRFRSYYKVKNGLFKKIRIYGPSLRLANISILELSYADTFFYNWIMESKDIDLHRLCAVLYRPAGNDSQKEDRRQKFNKLLLPDNAKFTDQIPLHQKYMIALAYQGTRQVLIKRHPLIFPVKSKSAEGTNPKPAAKKTYSPFTKIINAMVLDEVQPFGGMAATESANAHQFLEVYSETLKRNKEQERLAKKKR